MCVRACACVRARAPDLFGIAGLCVCVCMVWGKNLLSPYGEYLFSVSLVILRDV